MSDLTTIAKQLRDRATFASCTDSLKTLLLSWAEAVEREQSALVALRESKDNAYQERDLLVAAMSKLFPASLERHPEDDKEWEDDWRWIVFIELPSGQATWHIHDSELILFQHLVRNIGKKWDGHTTPEKYERLRLVEPRFKVRENFHEGQRVMYAGKEWTIETMFELQGVTYAGLDRNGEEGGSYYKPTPLANISAKNET